jgi:hypothetical protein
MAAFLLPSSAPFNAINPPKRALAGDTFFGPFLRQYGMECGEKYGDHLNEWSPYIPSHPQS